MYMYYFKVMKTVDAPVGAVAGQWTQMFGTNSDFDCIDCRQATIAVSGNDASFDVKYRLGNYLNDWGFLYHIFFISNKIRALLIGTKLL